jgi:hypothetical protein
MSILNKSYTLAKRGHGLYEVVPIKARTGR